MTQDNIIILIIAAIAVSALAIIPLARIIPRQMMTEWRDMVIESGHGVPKAIAEAGFQLSLQYKLVICLAGGAMGLLASFAYGVPIDAALMCLYFLGLILMVAINLKHELLPDVVVFSLLWIGLLYSGGSGNTAEYVSGAAIGYFVPFLLMAVMRCFTDKELLAPADPKALAMAGAWFGMAALPFIFAVFIGAGIVLILLARFLRQGSIPTGPAHFIASLGYMISTRVL